MTEARKSDYDTGFEDGFISGIEECIRQLRLGADDYEASAADSRKVAEAGGMKLAAGVLKAWANGIEMKLSK